ncbi:GntR family transcriptional regulator [Novosphingobium sp. G106]|uniref:GntR family transcriptional regulator n=1 Tax=Novosphingobium sp. G106 TaxID=2849500 RepID=UPI001C2CF250|nr:GntR family transcriptional regulator [Novosphingobium sp. G106]MBV1691395.1 GntR family transcriptional regulator [Novosphingobium sp. G106]
MSPGQTTDRIYDLVKRQVMTGERRPGEHLDPARLAADLHASTTPVRDALHQLYAQRLIEAWPREGFKVPTPTESGLRDLYAWNGDLLVIVLRGKSLDRKSGALPSPVTAPEDGARSIFAAMAAAFGNGEHRHAIGEASDRLHLARLAEVQVLSGMVEELTTITTAWSLGCLSDLRAAIARYHRRRQRSVSAIVARMIAPAPDAKQ